MLEATNPRANSPDVLLVLGIYFHLLKNMLFALLVLTGIHHYWTYLFYLFVQGS